MVVGKILRQGRLGVFPADLPDLRTIIQADLARRVEHPLLGIIKNVADVYIGPYMKRDRRAVFPDIFCQLTLADLFQQIFAVYLAQINNISGLLFGRTGGNINVIRNEKASQNPNAKAADGGKIGILF